MHSLEELKSGKLIGVKRLSLACDLKEFPEEILTLADTLEILDLSGNNLHELPDSIVALKKLKIIFFQNNKFTEFPKILSKCPSLEMIGFKSNQITIVPEDAFPTTLKWLILTNNKIKKLPKSIGDCPLLRKCALAGNQIEELPVEMANCTDLELLRISANKLKELPKWLFALPKLSWIAFGGNATGLQIESDNDLESFDWNDFEVKELLGEGASGFISKAIWNSRGEEVAVKVFKGAVTSDGLPEDEMKIAIEAGTHQNLIPILGKIKNHPEQKSGLIMKLIPAEFINLGNPPSLQTCTRDTFEENTVFTFQQLLAIAKSIASVCCQLHEKGINHGDLYAHNILINNISECLLGDFGASSFYDINSDLASTIERVEVRAFGCLLEDILNLVQENNTNLIDKWRVLVSDCSAPEVKLRPSFLEISDKLSSF